MTSIDQLEKYLPETACFHDSIITNIKIDYVKNKAEIHLDLCAGDPESNNSEEREKYIKGILTITGLIYFIIEPPDNNYMKESQGDFNEGLWVDFGFGNNPSAQIKIPQPLPKGAFYNWIFVNPWNSFIHIAAMDSKIEIMENI